MLDEVCDPSSERMTACNCNNHPTQTRHPHPSNHPRTHPHAKLMHELNAEPSSQRPPLVCYTLTVEYQINSTLRTRLGARRSRMQTARLFMLSHAYGCVCACLCARAGAVEAIRRVFSDSAGELSQLRQTKAVQRQAERRPKPGIRACVRVAAERRRPPPPPLRADGGAHTVKRQSAI